MASDRAHQWIRESLRTPGILIFGLVLAPCGWVLDLTATVAPNWRTLHNLPGSPPGFTVHQGIWDICTGASETSIEYSCGQQDTAYSQHRVVGAARGLMVASLVLTLIGLAVAVPGARCWRDDPRWRLAGAGGLLILCSGVMTLVPVAWYTHVLESVAAPPPDVDVRAGYCLVVGYVGGVMEVLAGLVMFVGVCRCCGGKNRGEIRVVRAEERAEPARRAAAGRSGPRREPRGVAYSRDDDHVSFPRAGSGARPADSRKTLDL